MDKTVPGKTLLVGEGDFSFTVAMVTKHPVTPECQIISTSIENAESITKHKNAAENMETLKKMGVRLVLEVDATKLHQHSVLKDEKFSRLIFNFPHAGGKSNHKKNRKLLNDFFASAVQVLDDDGQILVTLCKGQGGTPADKPMRAWHDSWQVVSMAANAGLILVCAEPFREEDFMAYTSTGFRSLDKGFHTDNAITHVFERADPVNVPDGKVNDYNVKIEEVMYSCLRYMYHKLQVIREIENNMTHPFYLSVQFLTREFMSDDESLEPNKFNNASNKTDGAELSISTETHINNTSQFKLENKSCRFVSFNFPADKRYTLKKIKDCKADHCLTVPPPFFNHTKVNTSESHDNSNQELHFRTSLLENFSLTDTQVDWPYVITGPVFRPCIIKTDQLPVCHQMLVIFQISSIEYKSERTNIGCSKLRTEDLEAKADSSQTVLESKVEDLDLQDKSITNNQLQSSHMGKVCIVSLIAKTIASLKILLGERYAVQFYDTDLNKVDQKLGKKISVKFKVLGYFVVFLNSEASNYIQIGELIALKQDVLEKGQDYIAVGFYIDEIASIKLDIQDKRLLYSLEKCVTDQFLKLNFAGKLKQIKAPSLYPMTFIHDMSFWENDGIDFDEIEFCNVIRDIADDVVINVELIDRYKDPGTGRHSRCYRMTFQSSDKALCYDTSWKLQSIIRLEVEKHLKITLR